MDIRSYLEEKRRLVEEGLQEYMLSTQGPLTEHVEAMRYSLFAGGKRIRPILCLAAAEALQAAGTPPPAALLPTACALECIHTYSLIHDDLPAMDNDELRRGKPTNHMVFGEAGAILAGDGLLTFAFELLSNPDTSVPAQERLQIIQLISRAAGPRGMVGGQALDLASEGRAVSFEDLRFIHSCKTGALITAAVRCGAILGRGSQDALEKLTSYGEKIGLAFQIVDDLLNVEGTAEELGKATGSDAARLKATYPAFFGVEITRRRAEEAVNGAIAALESFDQRAEPLRAIARYLLTRKR